MSGPTSRPRILCRDCGELLKEVESEPGKPPVLVVLDTWNQYMPADRCRARRIVGSLEYEGHVRSTRVT